MGYMRYVGWDVHAETAARPASFNFRPRGLTRKLR